MVDSLGDSCPWTASITPMQMIGWLRSELDELAFELQSAADLGMGSARGAAREGAGRVASGPEVLAEAKLISELGDVLFDALMLNGACSRHYGIDPDAGTLCRIAACPPYVARPPSAPPNALAQARASSGVPP